jgi:predicted dehydrogenase
MTSKVRLGFLGVGWIGRQRMQAIAESGAAEVAAIADVSEDTALAAARALVGGRPKIGATLEDLLAQGLDGVVIATPSAQHAEQAVRALEAGAAVFVQKPLGRSATEVRRVVDAARRAGKSLGVDLSYRLIRGVPEIRQLMAANVLGEIFAADLTFHNAYGPDKAWFYDPALSGGGCAMDLGIHLIDLALWMIPGAEVVSLHSQLSAGGRPLVRGGPVVEDHAAAQIGLRTAQGHCTAQLRCSWKLHAGRDAVIEAAFHGTRGGAALRNVNGSFYDFTVERYRGTSCEVIAAPPDAWGGRAAVAWASALGRGARFDAASAFHLEALADALDRVYAP